MTLKLAVSKSRPPVPYRANLLNIHLWCVSGLSAQLKLNKVGLEIDMLIASILVIVIAAAAAAAVIAWQRPWSSSINQIISVYLYRCWDNQHTTWHSWRTHSEGRLVPWLAHSTRSLSWCWSFAVDVCPSAKRRNAENIRQLDYNHYLPEAYFRGSWSSSYGLECNRNRQYVAQILSGCNFITFAVC